MFFPTVVDLEQVKALGGVPSLNVPVPDEDKPLDVEEEIVVEEEDIVDDELDAEDSPSLPEE